MKQTKFYLGRKAWLELCFSKSKMANKVHHVIGDTKYINKDRVCL